jgi:hypothetical protein
MRPPVNAEILDAVEEALRTRGTVMLEVEGAPES